MEKNKPISVAFEDIRNNPDFIEHSEYRFINDDLGMVISFQAMGFRLFRTQQPYRAKEGRIVRIMQGKGRISINLIEYEATAHPARLSRQEELFRRFIALVNQHSKHERSVNFYADKLCLTPHYLSSVIRETSGQTVMQWINQAVILEAKVLLKHSNLLVFQISDELNFPNPSFFSKFFKRMTGMTPAEYQKQT